MAEHSLPNLSADVFSVLKQRIVRWEYAPGHRFTEEGLCAEFNISRSPVREALHMLVENKLVDKMPRKGYSVKQLDLREIHELYDVRIALETFIVEWAAERGHPQDEWRVLYHVWQDLKTSPAMEASDFAVKDEEFHERLASWTGNQTLLQQIRSINERLHFIRITDIAVPGRLMTTCVQHLQILDSIKEHNAVHARESVRSNIEDGRTNVEHAIKEALARAYLSSRNGA